MRAITYATYGSPDVLELKEVEKPTPSEGEVLVEVHAASVNYGDWAFMTGSPFVVRLMGSGLLRPRNPILGADIAGRVEAVGGKVSRFRPGDEVFGDISECGFGGFAEYVAVREEALAPKPANLSFDEAAAVPQAAVTALQGLRDKGGIKPGQRVLISGASGGVGIFAVQIAKSFGAEVTGVCRARNGELLRSIGADRIIDYTQEDPTRDRYDLVVTVAGSGSIFDYRRALLPRGAYVFIGGSGALLMQTMLFGPWLSIGGRKMGNLASRPKQGDLVYVKELLEAGKVVPVIDRRFTLAETAEALRHYGRRHNRGKVVVVIRDCGTVGR